MINPKRNQPNPLKPLLFATRPMTRAMITQKTKISIDHPRRRVEFRSGIKPPKPRQCCHRRSRGRIGAGSLRRKRLRACGWRAPTGVVRAAPWAPGLRRLAGQAADVKVIEPTEQPRAAGSQYAYTSKPIDRPRPQNKTRSIELLPYHRSTQSLQICPFQSPLPGATGSHARYPRGSAIQKPSWNRFVQNRYQGLI